ncbi:MAG: 1-phosphofructokinase family hexose kinase [Clostridia bacterium]|nr:1-phosphofructokinase family hexose kinase [Clostridia bacterium]
MIYTITLNPAIDLYSELGNSLKIGATNRAKREYVLPGGKGINCSLTLNRLGCKNEAIAFVSGPTGIMLDIMLSGMGVATHLIPCSDTSDITRINLKLKGCDRSETEINGVGPSLSIADIEKLKDYLDTILTDDDFVIVSGNASASLGNNIYFELTADIANFSLDCEGDLLLNALSNKPYVIKPNLHELEEIAKRELTSDDDIIEEAAELIRSGAQNVIVSLGAQGAILVDGNFISYKVPAYVNPDSDAVICSTNGAGDTLLASFIYYSKIVGLSLEEALQNAVVIAGKSCY